MEPSPEPSPPITAASAASAAGGGDEPYAPSNSSSLFPLSAHTASSAPTAESQWLSNPSFSFDASSLHIPTTTSSSLPPPLSPSSDEEAEPKPALAKYELLPSSPSPPASDEERGSRRNDRKRRKRRREKERYDGASASRKPGVRAWAGSEMKPAKDYYFDAKGDQDNLAFGSIYRMDIARYKPQSMLEAHSLDRLVFFYNWGLASSHMDLDSDLDGLDSKVRAGGRYYSAKHAVLERNKGFKHLKVLKRDMSAMLPEDFIPVKTPSLPAKSTTAQQELEESWEDEVLRRTREFNKMSRECPHDEKATKLATKLEFATKLAKSLAEEDWKTKRQVLLENRVITINSNYQVLQQKKIG